MKQVDDYEFSILFCSCGATFTWSGWSDDLITFRNRHEPHDTSEDIAQTSEDGRRAYAQVGARFLGTRSDK